MKKLSVVVDGISNNERFINNLFTEIGNEITTEVNGNKVSFKELNSEKESILYKILSKKILDEYCKKTLVRIINKNCDCFSKSDKYEIWKMAMSYLLNDVNEKNSDYLNRITLTENKLREFFSVSQCVFVEGFVNFRLKELEEELEDIVEDCISEYMLEQEYKEFINMLKYFVSVQSPKYLVVEILYDSNILIFGDGKNITKECIMDFQIEVNDIEINTDDYILNSLITIAPKKITVIQKNKRLNNEIKKTLLGIFGDKIKIITE